MTPIIAAVAQENLHAGDLLEVDPATGFAVKATPGRVPGKWRQKPDKGLLELSDRANAAAASELAEGHLLHGASLLHTALARIIEYLEELEGPAPQIEAIIEESECH